MPTSARDDILATIRRGLKTGQFPGQSDIRSQLPPASSDAQAMAQQFGAELGKLFGKSYFCETADEACQRVLAILSQSDAHQILAWDFTQIALPGLTEALQDAGVTPVAANIPAQQTEARRVRLSEIDTVKVGLTGAVAAFADTGSILVAASAGRGRLASLITPVHIAVLPLERLHASMRTWYDNEAKAGHSSDLMRQSSNVVTITGPSRSADIEGQLQLGVHGPKDLHVILWG